MQTKHFLSSISIDIIGDDYKSKVSDTEKLFELPKAIEVPQHTHALIAVRSFNMVNSTYLIKSGINDTITIETQGTGGTVEVIFTISAGNYTITELVSSINAQISANLGTLNLESLAFSINATTHVLDFTASYDTYTLTQISFISTAYIELGLNNNTASVYSTASGSFPKIFNCQGNNTYYLRAPNLHLSNQNTKGISNVLATIPILVGFGDMIYYEIQSEPIYHRLMMPSIQEISIQILDENMNALGDLLSLSTFRLSLLIHFNYDHDRDIKLIKKDELFKNHSIGQHFKRQHAKDIEKNHEASSQGNEKSREASSQGDEQSREADTQEN
jgi:hypothetical protein